MPKTVHGELVKDLRSMDKILSEILRNHSEKEGQARLNWAFAVALTHILTILIRKEESREN